MAEKRLPIVIDNYVKSECWTQLLLSIIQTSKYAPAWLASHIGLIGLDDVSCWYGNLSKVFSYRDALDILNFEEVNLWDITPDRIIDFIKREIDAENYVVVELKYSSGSQDTYRIHEQLVFGYDDNRKVLFGSVMSSVDHFVEVEISYDEMRVLFGDSYNHFKEKCNKNDFIYWSRSNFFITRINLRADYRPHGCEYTFLQNLIIEADGKECKTTQYDAERNVRSEKTMYSGIACLLAAEKYIEKFLHDRSFVEKDTDPVYNDLFGRLSFNLSKNFYKLYEHRMIILESLHWFYGVTNNGIAESLQHVEKYEECCRNMDICYKTALKFCLSRDWSILEHLNSIFAGQYEAEHIALNALICEMKELWYIYKSYDK